MDKLRDDTASEAMATVDRSEGITTVRPIVNLRCPEIIALFPIVSQIDQRLMAGRAPPTTVERMVMSPNTRSTPRHTTHCIALVCGRSLQILLQIVVENAVVEERLPSRNASASRLVALLLLSRKMIIVLVAPMVACWFCLRRRTRRVVVLLLCLFAVAALLFWRGLIVFSNNGLTLVLRAFNLWCLDA